MPINQSQSVGLATLLIAGGSWMGTASAATLQVCPTCGHTTIQSAVNDAADNDVINIAAGRYVENITIIGKTLTLLGTGGLPNGQTLVAAAGRGPVFTLGSGVTGDANHLIVISGVTVSGGNHSSGTGVGGGIQVRAGSYLHLLNSIVTGNFATFGGGVGVNSPGAPATSIISSLIADNISPGTPRGVGLGGGVYARQGDAGPHTIRRSTLSHNTVSVADGSPEGGGILAYASNTGSYTLDHSFVEQNLAGGGVWTDPNVALVLVSSVISDNTGGNICSPAGCQ